VCEIEREGYGCGAFEGALSSETTTYVGLPLTEFYLTVKYSICFYPGGNQSDSEAVVLFCGTWVKKKLGYF
jgi:hypothetical protein